MTNETEKHFKTTSKSNTMTTSEQNHISEAVNLAMELISIFDIDHQSEQED